MKYIFVAGAPGSKWSIALLNNHMLCNALNISLPPVEYNQDYSQSDIKVTVI